MGTPIRGKTFRVPDPTDAIPLSPDGYTTVENLPGGSAPIVTVIANDTDIIVAPFNGTTVVLYTALTATRTVTLPPASGPSQIVVIKDLNGNVAEEEPWIQVSAVGGDLSLVDAINHPNANVTGFNDGTSTWASDIPLAFADVQVDINRIFAQLGGTDGDGNVYSIQYDPNGESLALQCVSPGADGISVVLEVVPGGAQILVTRSSDGSRVNFSGSMPTGDAPPEFDIEVDDGTNRRQVLAAFAPSSGIRLAAQNLDTSVGHAVLVSQDDGVQIDGVTVDPTLPWPGG